MDITGMKRQLEADGADATDIQPTDWEALRTRLGDTIPGGTAITSYAVGDLLYASSTSALSKLADVAVGSVLVSGGVGVAPAWSTVPAVAAVAIGTNPAAAGGIRLPNSVGMNFRNQANSADLQFFASNRLNADDAVFGDTGGNTLFRSALGAPTSPTDGYWWVEVVGTSPTRIAAIKVRDGGATRTIASVTY